MKSLAGLKKIAMDSPWLTVSIISGAIITAVHLVFAINIPDDVAAYYGPMVEAFGRGEWSEALAENVPPLVPLLAGLIHQLGLDAFTSLMLVSAIFYLLTLVPLYKFLTLFVPSRAAGLGCLLYIIAPKIIQMGCSGLLNSGRNFFFMTAAWLLLSCGRKLTIGKTALFATALAGLTLVRGEGIIYLPLFLSLFVWLARRLGTELSQWRTVLAHLAAVVVVFAVLVSPRFWQIYQCTGIPAADIRQADMIASWLDNAPRYVDLSNDSDPDYGATEVTTVRQFRPNWRQLRSEISFVNGEAYLWLAVLGVILLWRRRELRAEHWAILSFIIWNILIFLVVAFNLRYFTLNIILLMPLTVYGLLWLNQWCCNHRLTLLLPVAGIILGIWQIYCGAEPALNRRHADEPALAGWLRQNQRALIEATGKTDFDRQLVILSNRPQFSFRSGAAWVKPAWRKNHWEIPPVEVLQAQNTDLAIVRKPTQFSQTIASSKHFIPLQHPGSASVAIYIFRPVTDANNDSMPTNEPETETGEIFSTK